MIMFFFFQAEDGIRVVTVTGVQTCALPIWPVPSPKYKVTSPELKFATTTSRWPSPSRSEERRGGKECRSRWSPDHQKQETERGSPAAAHTRRDLAVGLVYRRVATI